MAPGVRLNFAHKESWPSAIPKQVTRLDLNPGQAPGPRRRPLACPVHGLWFPPAASCHVVTPDGAHLRLRRAELLELRCVNLAQPCPLGRRTPGQPRGLPCLSGQLSAESSSDVLRDAKDVCDVSPSSVLALW